MSFCRVCTFHIGYCQASKDTTAIELLQTIKAYLADDDTLYFGEPECFDTEAEALAFCAGIGHGLDERATVARYPLRSCEPGDVPFIEAIEGEEEV